MCVRTYIDNCICYMYIQVHKYNLSMYVCVLSLGGDDLGDSFSDNLLFKLVFIGLVLQEMVP